MLKPYCSLLFSLNKWLYWLLNTHISLIYYHLTFPSCCHLTCFNSSEIPFELVSRDMIWYKERFGGESCEHGPSNSPEIQRPGRRLTPVTQNEVDKLTRARTRMVTVEMEREKQMLHLLLKWKNVAMDFTLHGAKCKTVETLSCNEEHCFSTMDSSWVAR